MFKDGGRGIRWCPCFSGRSYSWSLGRHLFEEAVQSLFLSLDFEDGFASLQFCAITPTVLRVKAFSDTSVPTSDDLRLVFLVIRSSSTSLAQGCTLPKALTHACVHECAHPRASMQARKGTFIFSVHPFIPACLKFLRTCTHGISSRSVNQHREVFPCGERLCSLIPEWSSLKWPSQSCCTGIAMSRKALPQDSVIC